MIQLPRLLDEPNRLNPEIALRFYEESLDEFHQQRTLLRHNEDMPPHMFFNLFNQPSSKIVFEEDIRREIITNKDFLNWWDKQDLRLQEEALLSLVLTKSKYREMFFEYANSKKEINFRNLDLFQDYFKTRDLNELFSLHQSYHSQYVIKEMALSRGTNPYHDKVKAIKEILKKSVNFDTPDFSKCNQIEIRNVLIKDLSYNHTMYRKFTDKRHNNYRDIDNHPIIVLGDQLFLLDGYNKISYHLLIGKKDICAIILK